jgi:hypothetical protein
MQRFSAAAFFSIATQLSIMSENAERERQGGIAFSITPEQRETFLTSLRQIEAECKKLDLKVSLHAASEAIYTFERSKYFGDLGRGTEQLRNTIEWEMRSFLFFHVPSKQAEFYAQQELFGPEVKTKFPSIHFDMVEAGNCYAMGRGTACVFHLMRVLEIALTAFGGKFGVSLSHTNWGPAIDQIESKIRGMNQDPAWKAIPDWKDQQEFFAQAASYLGVTKDAWRNYTAHARGKYTQEEAELMLLNVRSFMEKISQRMSE